MPLFGVLNFFFWAVLYKSGTLLRFAYIIPLCPCMVLEIGMFHRTIVWTSLVSKERTAPPLTLTRTWCLLTWELMIGK